MTQELKPVTYYGAVNSWTVSSSAAFQASVNDQGVILIPPGDWLIDQPIYSNKPLRIIGAGQHPGATITTGGSRILIKGDGMDGFRHDIDNANGLPGYHNDLHISGVNFCAFESRPAHAINASFNNGAMIVTDVNFSQFQPDRHFQCWAKIEAGAYTKFTRVQGDGGTFNKTTQAELDNQTQIAFHLYSPGKGREYYGAVFDNCDIMAVQHGVFCEVRGTPGFTGTMEGIIFRDCFGRSVTGPWFRQWMPESAGYWFPPYYQFDRLNYEGSGSVCDIDSASEVTFQNCLLYGNKPFFANQPLTDFVRIGYAENFRFKDNATIHFAGTQTQYMLSIYARADGVFVRDNTFHPHPANPNSGDPAATYWGGVYLVNNNSYVEPATGNKFKNWGQQPQLNGI